MNFKGKLTQKQVAPQENMFFVVEKHIEDVKQGQKSVPDLLALVMKASDPVKEELRRKTIKMTQFRTKIQGFRVSTFWMS